MTHHHPHDHSHHHHAGEAHPPSALHASILRLSALERLGAAAVVLALLWVAVWWALK